jgi:short-subunit dehydrogenase
MSAFTGRVVIVTGASEGIGRAFCRALAPDRPRLVIAARNGERLESLAEQCRKDGAEVLVHTTDVTAAESCRALVDATLERYSAIDVLVNNAGGTMWSPFAAISDPSIFERLMRLNYLGCVYPTYYALPHLQRTRGRIVAVASVAGLTGVPERTAYAATKHAVVGLFESLRIELAPSGVSVTIVCPDFVASEAHRRALGPDGQAIGQSPLDERRVMSAERCAQLMLRSTARRDRLLITSARGRAGRWLRLLVPRLIDGIAERAIQSGR